MRRRKRGGQRERENERERKKTDQACFLPLQLLITLPDASSIHMTKLVTKSDRVEKLHGIIKSLLLTSALLDYFSFLLIQKNQSVSELVCLLFSLSYYSNDLQKNISHISNSKQHSASTHAVNSCRGGFSLKICLTNLKSIKHSYFSSGTEEQIIYHPIKT